MDSGRCQTVSRLNYASWMEHLPCLRNQFGFFGRATGMPARLPLAFLSIPLPGGCGVSLSAPSASRAARCGRPETQRRSMTTGASGCTSLISDSIGIGRSAIWNSNHPSNTLTHFSAGVLAVRSSRRNGPSLRCVWGHCLSGEGQGQAGRRVQTEAFCTLSEHQRRPSAGDLRSRRDLEHAGFPSPSKPRP